MTFKAAGSNPAGGVDIVEENRKEEKCLDIRAKHAYTINMNTSH